MADHVCGRACDREVAERAVRASGAAVPGLLRRATHGRADEPPEHRPHAAAKRDDVSVDGADAAARVFSRRHRDAHDHASAAHGDDARGGARGSGRRLHLRAGDAEGEHGRARPRCRCDGHRGRGVLPDQDRAELHARGSGERSLRCAARRRRRCRDSQSAGARRVLRRHHICGLRGRSGSALAGRTARARAPVDWWRTGRIPLLCVLRRSGGGRARAAVRRIPGGDRRGDASVRSARDQADDSRSCNARGAAQACAR